MFFTSDFSFAKLIFWFLIRKIVFQAMNLDYNDKAIQIYSKSFILFVIHIRRTDALFLWDWHTQCRMNYIPHESKAEEEASMWFNMVWNTSHNTSWPWVMSYRITITWQCWQLLIGFSVYISLLQNGKHFSYTVWYLWNSRI